jgi:transcriptional regulator with XRE-family HTH domain
MIMDDEPEVGQEVDAPTASQVLAAELPNVRKRQGLTAEDLALRVKLHGGKLDRAAISKIENRLRDVSLDDAILLAVALGISPLHLFVPRDDDAFVAVAPAWNVAAALARRWVRGEQPLQFQDDRVYRTEVPESEWATRNERLVQAQHEADAAVRRWRVAREMANTIIEELAEFDRKHPASSPLPLMKPNQMVRLESRLGVAYEQIAEAKVEVEDAEARLRAIRDETQTNATVAPGTLIATVTIPEPTAPGAD